MQQYNCIIIEDEPLAAEILQDYIADVPFLNLKQTYPDAIRALEGLVAGNIDLIFLDINLPKLKGLDFIQTLKHPPNIIITTAYHEYALQGYELNVVDYLLKPITLNRFLSSTQKIEAHFNNHHAADLPPSPPEKEYFFVKSGKTLSKIRMEDILYFEGEKEYVRLVTTNERLLIYRRLKDIDEQLHLPFMRVHNSYIVNTKQISKIQDNHIHIGGKQIPLSEKFRADFMALIQQRLF